MLILLHEDTEITLNGLCFAVYTFLCNTLSTLAAFKPWISSFKLNHVLLLLCTCNWPKYLFRLKIYFLMSWSVNVTCNFIDSVLGCMNVKTHLSVVVLLVLLSSSRPYLIWYLQYDILPTVTVWTMKFEQRLSPVTSVAQSFICCYLYSSN